MRVLGQEKMKDKNAELEQNFFPVHSCSLGRRDGPFSDF
jgi:hypothetical protein